MTGRKAAVIQASKGLLQVSLTTIAAIGSATGNVWLAGATALPGALLGSETLHSLLGQKSMTPLTLPMPPWWTGSAQTWQATCEHVEHQLPTILQELASQLRNAPTIPAPQQIRQALIDALAQHLPAWEVKPQERSLVADYLAPLLLQHITSELHAVIDPIRQDKTAELVTQVFQQLQQATSAPVLAIATPPSSAATSSPPTPSPLLEQKMLQRAYDVYLCYAEQDETVVMQLAEQLKTRGLLPWLDEIDVRPGTLARQQQEQQIETIPAAAIIVGQHAVEHWQALQMYSFLNEFVARGCPVIPVLLADAPNKPKLPVFLANFAWVDFRRQTPDPIEQLWWGITGKRA